MAYFDSSKNRALWEIRLGQLRKERELREMGGAGDAFRQETVREVTAGARVPVSYQELLREEAMASERTRGKERGAREISREKTQTQARIREEKGPKREMG